MLEEITMEKKLNRSLQSPKGSAEAKKNQDVAAGKWFPKASRKREKPGSKIEQFTKPSSSSPKNKQHGRRTTTRAPHHGTGGKVTELAGLDDEFDLKRSKKQNLTHLLNFHCKPRESASNGSYRSAPRGMFPCNSIRSLMTTQKHKYNKEQFLQANFQFVVRDDADYSVYLADPDILVDWTLIEQIRVSCFESVTCPICLETPIAGKITRCGHIYCWPCILHYLALTDASWHKCPICFEAVHKKDLKSVRLLRQQWYNTGEEITFQLMKREHGSTVAIPVLEMESRTRNVLLSVAENSCSTLYSKLLLVDRENIQKIINIEEHDLMKELKENEGCPEVCFVQQAIELLNERKLKLSQETDENLAGSCDYSSVADKNTANNNSSILVETSADVEVTPAECSFVSEFDGATMETPCENECLENQLAESGVTSRTRYESVSSGGEDLCTTVTAEDLEINANPNAIPSKYYFFYQAMDGQQIFLHSINARMLERHYGSLEHSPSILVGKIVEIESGSMTEELRKRLRYLQHLPITCQFQVVEIDVGEPLVSAETLTFFKDQLEKRTRLRQKRARDEKKMEKRAELLVRKQYGCRSPPRRLRLDSLHHFPECGAGEPYNVSPRTKSPISSRTSSPGSSVSRRSTSPTTSALNALSINNNTFAQKLKDTNKDGGWQKRAPALSDPGASSSYSRNLISDAVEVALIKARLEKESNEQNFGKNKKKKKKQKPVPLCSVGMVYTNQ